MKLNRFTMLAPASSPSPRSRIAARPAGAADPKDPRIGLKPGLRDAGTAALAWSSGQPAEAGRLLRSRGPGRGRRRRPSVAPGAPPEPSRRQARRRRRRHGARLHQFRPRLLRHQRRCRQLSRLQHLRRRERAQPRLTTSVVCPGGQGDVSVWGHLLFMSVEQTRGRLDCGLQGVSDTVSKERFRGIRIFDITDIRKPRQVAAVQTCRGSHTHTLVPDPKNPSRIFVYGSGTGTVRPGEELEGCSGKDAKEDPNTSLFSIDVIEVPLGAPQNAKIVNQPRIFMDEGTGNIAGLWQGGNHGEGTQSSRMTNQCHDITVYSSIGLAAGACSGNGILLDICRSDRTRSAWITSWTRASRTGTPRPSTTTARRWCSPTSGAAARARAAGRPIPRPGAPTRSSTSSTGSCSSRATTRCRRRRPSRRTASLTTDR